MQNKLTSKQKETIRFFINNNRNLFVNFSKRGTPLTYYVTEVQYIHDRTTGDITSIEIECQARPFARDSNITLTYSTINNQISTFSDGRQNIRIPFITPTLDEFLSEPKDKKAVSGISLGKALLAASLAVIVFPWWTGVLGCFVAWLIIEDKLPLGSK